MGPARRRAREGRRGRSRTALALGLGALAIAAGLMLVPEALGGRAGGSIREYQDPGDLPEEAIVPHPLPYR